MSESAHEYTVMLQRVLSFGVICETLTKQERVDRPGRRKPSSRHVPSGSFRISLDVSGAVPVPKPDNDSYSTVVEGEAAKLNKLLQEGIRPIRDRLAAELKTAVGTATDSTAIRRAVALSSVLKDVAKFAVHATCPEKGWGMLTLSGSVTLDPPIAEDVREQLVNVLEGVLKPHREASVEMVRALALNALEQS